MAGSIHIAEGAGPLVVLVGVPGAGKTTIGLALAEKLGGPFRDTDADVEATTGRLIADIFVESGEAEFRRIEAAAVATALAEHAGVLALGGGAVLDPTTRERLRGRPVVWLRVGLAAASRRAGLSSARPLLFGNLRAQLKALMDERAALYDEVASLTIDTDELPPEEVVAAIVAGLGLYRRPVAVEAPGPAAPGEGAPQAAREAGGAGVDVFDVGHTVARGAGEAGPDEAAAKRPGRETPRGDT